ncbi:hypothetical protein AB7Z54_04640 [Providencia manganoxydans]|uniref:hypothetical protein n=1 Tax=Providencia manganoxydans TaxID=2923283 RepID=UPI0032DBEE59
MKRELLIKDINQLFKLRGGFSDYVNLNWYGKDKVILPLRSNLSEDSCLISKDGIFLGDVYLTRKELLSLKLLLSNKNINEVSAIQGNEVEDEIRIVSAILKKFGDDFVKTLNYHGITLSILNLFCLYP